MHQFLRRAKLGVCILGMLIAAFLTMQLIAKPKDKDRVATARKRCEASLRARFEKAGVKYPAAEVFFRAMKREAVVELWANSTKGEPLKLVATFAVTKGSGGPGPKRIQGDGQVPEGFYEVDRFNPQSLFHLSLGLNYPNASDRILSDRERPGDDIFIHGKAASVGCLPLGDAGIEEVYLAALDSRARPVRVHIFPARMDAADWPAWRDEQTKQKPALAPFWAQFARGWELFEKDRRPPAFTVGRDGSYNCTSGR